MARAKLYAFGISHPVCTARLMLDFKGIDYTVVPVIPGFHPQMLRLHGFRGRTVPAVKIDGRRAQGTLEISRLLDDVEPDPPLFPDDPEQRARVEAAEHWGSEIFQELPRMCFRWSLNNDIDTVEWLIRNEVGWIPAKRLNARLNKPVSAHWARRSGADDDAVRRSMAELPRALDHVDELIANGTIGGETPNAADFQIAPTVRVCLAAPLVKPEVEGRPCADLAYRLMPEYPGEPIPLTLPDTQPASKETVTP